MIVAHAAAARYQQGEPRGVVHVRDRAGGGADAVRASHQRGDLGRRSCRLIFGPDAVTTAIGDEVLARERARRGIEQAYVLFVPLHPDRAPDPARRRRVVRSGDFDKAVEADRALAEGVVAKRLERQHAQVRSLLGKHRRDLTLGRAVDPRVGPARVPVVEPHLRLVKRRVITEALRRA